MAGRGAGGRLEQREEGDMELVVGRFPKCRTPNYTLGVRDTRSALLLHNHPTSGTHYVDCPIADVF